MMRWMVAAIVLSSWWRPAEVGQEFVVHGTHDRVCGVITPHPMPGNEGLVTHSFDYYTMRSGGAAIGITGEDVPQSVAVDLVQSDCMAGRA